MTDHILSQRLVDSDVKARNAMKIAVQAWFVVAVIGQWLFAYYMVMFYGGSAVNAEWSAWNIVLKNGIVDGDGLGNWALGLHILFGALITVGGPLQMIPQVRQKYPVFHRWNGRSFVASAILIGIAGIYLNLTRENQSGDIYAVGNSINGLLMVICAVMAVRLAIARKFLDHRVWALRLFIMASGVWFSRVMMMSWFIIAGGPVGIDTETFQGPFVDILAFAHFLIPLAFLEYYFWVGRNGSKLQKTVFSVAMWIVTVIMLAGIGGATMFLWLPLLES